MKFFILILAVSLLAVNVQAQTKFQYSSQNYIGILEGEFSTSFQLQTINGFRKNNWFAGLGTGIDYYYERSIPVFASVSRFLKSTKVPLYFTADVGVNFPWVRNWSYIQDPGEFKAGLYGAGGIGYKFGFKKSSKALLLNLGYNYKRLTQSYVQQTNCLVPPCPIYTEKYDYRLRRLSVRVGFMF